MNALEERIQYVEQKAKMGHSISGVLSGEPDVDDSYLYDWDGNAATATEATNAGTVGGYLPGEVPYITDGSAPVSSPTPAVAGGPRFLSVKWAAIANPDLVTYEVHVIDAATRVDTNWVPDASTLVGETPGLLAFIYKDSTGAAFVYETDYYVKIVAKDEDGSAAASAEAGPEQLDPNGSDDILAGAVTAEHIESVFNYASAFIAGAFGSSNVQVGFGVKDDGAGNPILDSGFIGIRAYDGTNADPIFKLPADGSPAQFRGVVRFGSDGSSKLLQNDTLQLLEQPGGSFANRLLVQSIGAVGGNDTTVFPEFESDPVVGNVVILVLQTWDISGTSATNTVAGFTSLHNNEFGSTDRNRVQIAGTVVDGAGDGTPGSPVSVTFSKEVDVWSWSLFEFSGVTLTENVPSEEDEDNTGGVMALNTTGIASTSNPCLLLGIGAMVGSSPSFPSFRTSSYPSDWTLGIRKEGINFGLLTEIEQVVFYKSVGAGDTSAFLVETNSAGEAAVGIIIALEAAANQVEPAEPDTARLYAADVAGNTYLHTQDEDGRESSLVLGAAGEVFRLEIVTVSVNIPNTALQTGGSLDVTVSGVVSGDRVAVLGRADSTGRNFIVYAASPVTVADTVTLQFFNADDGPSDPGAVNYDLLVIHRS
jgi:hypothetical protein